MSDFENSTIVNYKGLLPEANIAVASAVILAGVAISAVVCCTWHQPAESTSRTHTAMKYSIAATGTMLSVMGIIYVVRNS